MADIAAHFNDLLIKIAKEQYFFNYDLDVKPISSGGANYTSKLYIVTITEGSNVLHLFAKIAAIGEKMRTRAPKVYETERYCYTQLVKLYEKIQNDYQVLDEHKLTFSKFYGCHPNLFEETIVLENLEMNGYNAYDRFKSVDWPYASTAVGELAKMQAISFAHAKYYPEDFSKVMEKCTFEWKMEDASMKIYMGNVISRAAKIVDDEHSDKLLRFFETTFESPGQFAADFKSSRRPLLSHGDFRPSNLMHKHLDDGKVDIKIVDLQTLQGGSPVTDLIYFIFTGSDEEFRAKYYEKLLDHYYTQLIAAMRRLNIDPEETFSREDFDNELKEDGKVDIKIVDLQTLQGGSPVTDLIYFIFTGSDEEFRAKYYEKLLDHYYTQLIAAMRRLNIDPEETFSREDFDNELKEKLPFGLTLAVFALPVVTVDSENAPEVNESLDISNFSVEKTSDLYVERLNGVVNDYVKWGILK